MRTPFSEFTYLARNGDAPSARSRAFCRRLIMRSLLLSFLLAGFTMISHPAFAHGDLHQQIQEVTRKINAGASDAHDLSNWYFERAELRRAHGEYPQAEADLARVEKLDPDRHDVDLARGRLWLDAGQPAKAQAPLARFLERHQDHPEALFTQAQALARLGWGERAVTYLDRALARHPQPEPDHYVARADILVALGESHYARAIRGLDEGCKRLGPIVQLETRALELEIELGRHERALARIDRIAKTSARKDLWLAKKAQVLHAAGRLDAAAQVRRQALAAVEDLPPGLRDKQDAQALKQQLTAQLGEAAPRRSTHAR